MHAVFRRIKLSLEKQASSLRLLMERGSARSAKAKRNILISFILKTGNIAAGLLLVPLTIDYVDTTQYGIWITLSSVIGWFGFFDIGLGNGLRNRFAESVARDDHGMAKAYVSTTYAILSIVIVVVLICFLLINPMINWSAVLNAPAEMAPQLNLIALLVFVFFCLQFILQLLNTILAANQEPSKGALLSFLGSFLSLMLIYFLTKTTAGNLTYLAVALSCAPVVVLIGASVYLFGGKYKRFSPSLKYVRKEYMRNLLGLGGKFFIIQLAAIIFFQTDNMVITQIFGPEDVTVFNMALKLFSVVLMIFTIIVSPLWSAFTDAYTSNDYNWINSILKKIQKIWIVLMGVNVAILFLSPFIFEVWLGNSVHVPFILSASFAFYIVAYTWQTIHVYFLNGIGKITLQLYLVVLSGILNIPIAVFLGKRLGLAGVTLSNTILFLIMGWFFTRQSKKILNRSATGIWNK